MAFYMKKFGSGSAVVGTVAREPQLRTTRNGKSYVTFSVYAGKDSDESKVYVNCKAWSDLAPYCIDLQKRDPIFAIGHEESYEYEGTTYTNLVLDWLNSPAIAPDAVSAEDFEQEQTKAQFKEVDDSEDSLPF